MTEPLIIAIDGPAGAGKSTVAQTLACRLGLAYVDSGATYRAAALKVLESGVALEDEDAVVRVVGSAVIGFVPRLPQPQVILDGKDVTAKIRALEVTRAASRVSQLPAVRQKLVALQRSLVKPPGVVMEGRDIGTAVFPGSAAQNLPQGGSGRAGTAKGATKRAAGPAVFIGKNPDRNYKPRSAGRREAGVAAGGRQRRRHH